MADEELSREPPDADLPSGGPDISIPIGMRRLIFVAGLASALTVFFAWLPNGTRLGLVISLFERRSVVIPLLGFLVIALSLLWGAGQRLDAWIFLYFNTHRMHTPLMDGIMWGLTQIGNFGFALLMATFFAITGFRRVAMVLLLGLLSLWLLVELVKAITDRARPFVRLKRVRIIGMRALGLSFPSGHTAQTFFLTTVVIHHFHLGLVESTLCYALAVLVGFTRIFVGAHYPRDVLAGAILGGVWGVMTIFVDNYLLGLP